MQALLAEPKPSELALTNCKLCDQLQADLTERDNRTDMLEQALASVTKQAHELTLKVHAEHGSNELDADCMADVAALYAMANLELPKPAPPCQDCGTPGWTGACDKCVPY